MLERMVWLIPLLPMLAALWIGIGVVAGWNRGETGERPTARVSLTASLLSLLLLLIFDLRALLDSTPGQLVVADWLTSGSYNVSISFTLDVLGLAMATLFALLCLVDSLLGRDRR